MDKSITFNPDNLHKSFKDKNAFLPQPLGLMEFSLGSLSPPEREERDSNTASKTGKIYIFA